MICTQIFAESIDLAGTVNAIADRAEMVCAIGLAIVHEYFA